ncbi:hypothetical protein BUALT_Bualt12G0060200 [Buddleja alternifolia]|uniref:Uncharacterized protein n=1 Tax=Buddleja alternifolia TaxID=168488 RepID=A0AAV6WTV6_9LAMI|nr:hypothetical protein BUALT_Bualt12G0060200 [Buddleja alternifolia]
MSHAEDIIFCGKLMPYRKPSFDDKILKSVSDHYDSIKLSRRYCESLPDQVNRSIKSKNSRFTRSSRSLDCKRSQLRRNSSLVMKSEASDIHRSFSKGSAKSEALRGCNSKPRWYALVFGLVKFPPEMDMRDMKNRQVRRNPGSLFAAVDGGGRIPADRRSSWGYDLLRVLSCKSHASVGVAATSSIGLVPQV